MNVGRSAGAYFALQAAAVTGWWIVLLLVPSSRAHFRMGDASEAVLLAFWLPDLTLLALGSIVGAYLCLRGDARALAVMWLVCGAVSYATLYCFAFALMTDSAWLGVALMLPAMLLTMASTLAVSPHGARFFRQAKPARPAWNVTKTGVQIVFMWGVALLLLPSLIVELERRVGVVRFDFPFRTSIAVFCFLSFSLLGLWSGFTMARRGAGTPLPLDSPRRLVVVGAYGYVRNPMAIAGIGQGLAIALYFGSLFVLAYALIGVCVWQFLTRPLEEDDMRRNFGVPYDDYRRQVRCWLPRLKPYKN